MFEIILYVFEKNFEDNVWHTFYYNQYNNIGNYLKKKINKFR